MALYSQAQTQPCYLHHLGAPTSPCPTLLLTLNLCSKNIARYEVESLMTSC